MAKKDKPAGKKPAPRKAPKPNTDTTAKQNGTPVASQSAASQQGIASQQGATSQGAASQQRIASQQSTTTQQGATPQQAEGPQFILRHIYLKDASFESPRNPSFFQSGQQPKLDFTVKTRNEKIADDLYESVLHLTTQAKIEDKDAFLVEVQQAGIFLCKNLSDQQLEQVLATTCPNILFPYAREAIDSLLSKGGFPALMLAPINFEAIYAQRKQAAQQPSSAPPDTH